MKILFTIPNSKEGGISSFCQSVIPFLRSDIVVFKRGARTSKVRRIQLLDSLGMLGRFCVCLVSERPDVVFINTSLRTKSMLRDGFLITIAKLLRITVVTYVHGFDECCLSRRLLPVGIFFSDMMFVLATDFAAKLVSRGYRGRIVRTVNPVDQALITAVGMTQPGVLRRPRNLLFLSRLEEEKGIFIVLNMYEELRKDYPDLYLLIAGNGTAMDQVRRFVRERDIPGVELLGFVSGPDKISLYRRSDIYLFASKSEGLPISVLEAMLFGLPVVTCPVGGLKDFFVDGQMGALVSGSKSEDFAAATKALLLDDDLRYAVAQYNRQYALEHFDPRVVSGFLEKQISDLVHGT